MILPVGYAYASHEISIPGTSGPALITTGHDVSSLLTQAAVGDAIEEMWQSTSPLYALMGSNYQVVAIHILWRASAGDPVAIERSLLKVGQDGANTEPQQVSALLRKHTGLAGRRNRGRCYLPGINETKVNADGTLTSAHHAALETAWAASFGALAGADAPLVILHDSATVTPTPVTSTSVGLRVATQRRRLR